MASSELLPRARRAYELGRLRWALRLLPWAICAMVIAYALGRPAPLCFSIGSALILLLLWLGVSGGGAGRGASAGLLAGAVPLALPLLVRSLGHLCLGPSCMILCLPACVLGGAFAGVVLAARAAREGRSFVCGALAVAALTGCLGCSLAGVGGVLGMLAGGLLVVPPVLVLARRAT